MRITINEQSCINNGVTIEEILTLLVIDYDVNIDDVIESLISKGYITGTNNPKKPNIKYVLTSEGIAKINDCSADSLDYSEDEKERLRKLAIKLQEVYPRGRKDGTNYMWRGTVAEIVRKMKILNKKYNFHFTDEQAVKATEEYVRSFNGNYRYMQLLKYFILKTVRDEDGNVDVKSEFMSLIENEGQDELLREDWANTLI